MRQSKFHPSLNRHKEIMGVSAQLFGMELVYGVLCVNLQVPLMLGVLVPMHLLFRWLHRLDPMMIVAYLRYMKEGDLYDPWVHDQVREGRAKGYGKGLYT